MSGRAQPLPPLQGGMLVIATIGISVVTAMTVLDSTIANVALPTIAGNLGVASSQGTCLPASGGGVYKRTFSPPP